VEQAIDHTEYRYAFKISEAESGLYGKLFIRNQRPFIRRSITKGVPLLAFAILVIATIAFDLDLAMIAIISFAVGYFSLFIAIIWASRVLRRDLFRRTHGSRLQWECAFDDPGIVVKKGSIETRMTWDAISGVQDAELIVAFWYDPTLGFFIPGHVFSDAAARVAFANWATARVSAATQPPAAVSA
jgi:hypothetical protein